MSWVSIMSAHAMARLHLDWLASHPPRLGDLLTLVPAILNAICHGEAPDLERVTTMMSRYEWPRSKVSTVLKNPAQPLNSILAGAAIAAINGERVAREFLDELGAKSNLERPEASAAAAIAGALIRSEWTPTRVWSSTPTSVDAMYSEIVDSSLESIINVLNTPGASWYTAGSPLLVAISMIGGISTSLEETVRQMASRLRPNDSKRGRLLYKRMVRPPPPDAIEENQDTLGIAAIDLGERMDIYHDGLTYSGGTWKLKGTSARARTLLQLEEKDWDGVRAHVDTKTWKTIEKHRSDALHLLAIDPSKVTASPAEIRAARKRFAIDLDVVSVLDT